MLPAIDKMKVCQPADMAELADALGSGPSGRKVVEVRVLLSAPVSPVSGLRSQVSGNAISGLTIG